MEQSWHEAHETRNTIQRVEKAIKAYLSNCRANGLAEGTIANYDRITKKYMDFLKSEGYEEASIASVNDWKVSMSEDGVKITTLNFYMGVLKSFFDFAVACEMLEKSPVNPKLMPSKKAVNTEKKKSYKHVLDEGDFKRILYGGKPKGVSDANWKRNKAILVVLMTTALRNSELRDLRMRDLNFEEGTVKVEKGKGNKERLAAFPKVTQDVVKEYLESGYRPNNLGQDDFVFGTNEDGNWNQFDRFTLSQLVERNIRLATGKDGYRSHSCRHFAATFYFDRGVDMQSISEVLGHSSLNTTSIYIEKLRPALSSQKASMAFDGFAN
jgi:site-specific recombinase XerD